MQTKPDSLIVVMPVYNEEGAIANVLEKWTQKLDGMGLDYAIYAYNDGSRDGTSCILKAAAEKYAGRVIAVDKENSGHGATILMGYRDAATKAEWIFQTDSDDEMGPEKFDELWNRRRDFDFLLGMRHGRNQPLPRKIVSLVSRLAVRVFYGKNTVWDVNSPYRLMRSSAFADIFRSIPDDTFAPNIIVSGMVARRGMPFMQFEIPQRERQTGQVSIKKWKLLKAAVKSFLQTVRYSLK